MARNKSIENALSPEENERIKHAKKSKNVKHAKKSKNVKVAAEDAILAIERCDDGTVQLTLARGWKKVLPKKQEEDPASLILWDDDNLLATVEAFNAALLNPNGPAPPKWLNLGDDNQITIPALKAAILAHVQVAGGGGGIVGNAVIAPNTFAQYCRIFVQFHDLGRDAFFVAHAVCPIGRNYKLADRRNNTTAVADPIPPHEPDAAGVPVFA